MSYTRQIRIEFNHCDPAGIVFYPRYFEMANSVCENFFREEVGVPYAEMTASGHGVPIRHIEADFRIPSRLGELLDWVLHVERVGASSVTFRLDAASRLTIGLTQVWIGPDFRPHPWPAAMRAALTAHLVTT